MKTITPCLWCDGTAEEAAKFYTSVFPNSKIGKISTYAEAGKDIHGQKPGSAMTVEMELNGSHFMLLNGGADFKYNEAISFMVPCKDQKEIDYYWDTLIEGGGSAIEYGWLKDKYGLAWQIVPENFSDYLIGPADVKERYMAAMMSMKKLDMDALDKAARGESKAA